MSKVAGCLLNIQGAHTVSQNDQALKVAFHLKCKQMMIIHGHSIFHIVFYCYQWEKDNEDYW